MLVLIHYQKENIEDRLQKLFAIQKGYVENQYGIEKDLLALLKETSSYFDQTGQTVRKTSTNDLEVYLETALSGINPQTLEKVKTERRKMIKGAIYHCLSSLSDLLRNNLIEIENTLQKNRNTIEQIVITSLKEHLFSIEDISKISSIEEIESIWNSLASQVEQFKLLNKKMLMELLKQDIYILLDQVFDRIKN